MKLNDEIIIKDKIDPHCMKDGTSERQKNFVSISKEEKHEIHPYSDPKPDSFIANSLRMIFIIFCYVKC